MNKVDTQRVEAFIPIAKAICEAPVGPGVWAFETPSHGQGGKNQYQFLNSTESALFKKCTHPEPTLIL